MGRTAISRRELGRVEVLAQVRTKQLRVVNVAVLPRLSYRQAKRLWKRYGEEGAAGLKHRQRGAAVEPNVRGQVAAKGLGADT